MSLGMTSLMPIHAKTRRQVMTCAALAFGVLVAGPPLWAKEQEPSKPEMVEVPGKPENRARTSLHQEIEIEAAANRIYDALLSSKQFTKFSGLPAEIEPKAGGAFSMFGGLVVGMTIEVVPDQRIVQAWRPAAWDPGVYSAARFELKPQAGGTLIVLDHTGFPEGKFDSLDYGWHLHYWEPLKKFLA